MVKSKQQKDEFIKKAKKSSINDTGKISEENRAILRSRAQTLAEERISKKGKESALEIVQFILSYERYGIESSFIKEVYSMKDFTPVPCTPNFVKGITNLRGEIISVVDIKKFFNLPDKGLTDLNRLIIIYSNETKMGILADRILGVRMVPEDEIKSNLITLKDKRSDYLRGITSDRLIILDINRILSDPEVIVNEEVE